MKQPAGHPFVEHILIKTLLRLKDMVQTSEHKAYKLAKKALDCKRLSIPPLE
jgi:hypothetical protein